MNLPDKDIRSILVIDDDMDDFELVMEAINEINPEIHVYYAARCEDAIGYKDHGIDLILLDINMPYHDGFFWLKAIRENVSHPPVIMYTNSMSPYHIARAYQEGASLYYSKPDSFTGLINGLKKLLQLNWQNPMDITAGYHTNGKYKTFQV